VEICIHTHEGARCALAFRRPSSHLLGLFLCRLKLILCLPRLACLYRIVTCWKKLSVKQRLEHSTELHQKCRVVEDLACVARIQLVEAQS
jgi:hypothetical protein